MSRGRRVLGVVIGCLLVAGSLAAAHEAGDSPDPAAPRLAARDGKEHADTAPAPRPADEPTPSLPDVSPPNQHPSAAPTAPAAPTERDRGLAFFSDCEVFLQHVKTEAASRVTPYGLPSSPALSGDAPVMATPGGAAGGSDIMAFGPADGSRTNVQEAGVDEPDLVKHDGRLLVTVFDGRLRVVDLSGKEPSVAGVLELPAQLGEGSGSFLVGDRVVVMGTSRDDHRPTLRALLVDISEPTTPSVIDDIRMDGAYVSARLVDGLVRLVIVRHVPDIDFTSPADESESARETARAENVHLVERSSLEQWLPKVVRGEGTPTTPVTACASVSAPTDFSGFGITTVVTLDPATGALGEPASVLADTDVVYGTRDHLYVATSKRAPVDDDSEVAPPPADTEIHRFAVTDAAISYEASGLVPGHLPGVSWGSARPLAQWALSEHDGHLRVATTIRRGRDQAPSETVVTVLKPEAGILAPVGTLAGLGPGERLYAVRFMGDRAYLVTYREVDPLFVIDLSDPTGPRLLGELKVPGFSAYLHPVGDDLLLGVGQSDEDEDGMTEGSQASLFDVSDPANPQRVGHLALTGGDSSSEAEGDHRAFTWSASSGHAILPVTDFDWEEPFIGAVAISVGADGLDRAAQITHTAADDEECLFNVRRSRTIDGVLYTFSAAGVWGHSLADFSPTSVLHYEVADRPSRCERHEEPPASTTTTSSTTTTTTAPPSVLPSG